MLEMIGNYNIFDLPQNGEAMCVTTNGNIKRDGHAVMGAGIALQANKQFNVSGKLGLYLKQYGNRAFNLGRFQRPNGAIFTVFSLPTKHNWKDDSDINLIIKSCEQLMEMCDKFGVTKCYLTRPGCGHGNLNWEHTVKPWLSELLDDRFIVVSDK